MEEHLQNCMSLNLEKLTLSELIEVLHQITHEIEIRCMEYVK